MRSSTENMENGIKDLVEINLEIATSEPLVYDFDDKLNVLSKTKLD